MTSGFEHERLLTPAQVAAAFSVDVKTVCRWAQDGRITSIRTLGGHRRYKEAEVRALLADGGQERDPLDAPVLTLWPVGRVMSAGKALVREGVTTVRKLTAKTEGDLKALGFRPAQVEEVRLALARKDLTLRGDILDKAA